MIICDMDRVVSLKAHNCLKGGGKKVKTINMCLWTVHSQSGHLYLLRLREHYGQRGWACKGQRVGKKNRKTVFWRRQNHSIHELPVAMVISLRLARDWASQHRSLSANCQLRSCWKLMTMGRGRVSFLSLRGLCQFLRLPWMDSHPCIFGKN